VGRDPRFEVVDGLWHITCKAARDVLLFRDDLDRRTFLVLLGAAVTRARWVCLDFCLMGTHYHVVICTPEETLSTGMQRLNWLYSRCFNDRHGTKGHLFERRFDATFVQSPDHLLRTHRYVARNPVEAGLCATAADWPWSGYRALAGLEPARSFHDVPRALLAVDDREEVARRQLRWIVEGLVPDYAAAR
jgi:putative transposase